MLGCAEAGSDVKQLQICSLAGLEYGSIYIASKCNAILYETKSLIIFYT